MLKPSGMLIYTIPPVDAGATATVDLLADDDDAGNHYDVAKLDVPTVEFSLGVIFQADNVENAGSPGNILAFPVVTIVNGVITAMGASVANSAGAPGDKVGGRLHIFLPQAGNYGA